MAEYKTFIPAAWTEFAAKCKALFPFLKKTFIGTRAEWDVLSTAEKIKYDVCDLVDDVAGGELIVSDAVASGDMNPVTSNAVAQAINYSTDEIATGAKWIDGKPIYRKIISGTTPSSDGGVMVESLSNVSRVVNLYGMLEQRANGILQNHVPLNFYWSDTAYIATTYSYTLNGIYMKALGAYRNMPFYLVIEYTKTTD